MSGWATPEELLNSANAALEAMGERMELLEAVLRSMDVAGPSQPPHWYVDKARAALDGATSSESTSPEPRKEA